MECKTVKQQKHALENNVIISVISLFLLTSRARMKHVLPFHSSESLFIISANSTSDVRIWVLEMLPRIKINI
jgi:hypothetical protein